MGTVAGLPKGVRLALLTAAVLALSSAPASAATITVDEPADELNSDGDCSLREAIEAANANAAVDGCEAGEAGPIEDVVVLAPGAVYPLAIPPDGTPDDNGDGDLDVDTGGGPLQILGDPADRPTIDAAGIDRAIHYLNQLPPLTIGGVVIEDGHTTANEPAGRGGGILAAGSALTVVDSIVAGNAAELAPGGGIGGSGDNTITIEASEIADNEAGESGGGVFAEGTLDVTGAVVSSNEAGVEPGAFAAAGGGISNTGAELQINESTITANSVAGSSGRGGGVAATGLQEGSKTVAGSRITANEASAWGGGVYVSPLELTDALTVSDSLIAGNEVGSFGAGLYLGRGTLDLERSRVSGNTALSVAGEVRGGGVLLTFQGSLNAFESAITNNTAITAVASQASGGGIHSENGSVSLARTTVAENVISNTGGPNLLGAGIFAGPNGGSFSALNTTIADNATAGPVAAQGLGGGVHIGDVIASLQQTTIAGSFARQGGHALSEQGLGVFVLSRSVIEGTTPSEECASDGGNAFVSLGENVSAGASCGLTGSADMQGVDPMLAPLTDNGGPAAGVPGGDADELGAVETRALAPGSPAIDRSSAPCNVVPNTPIAFDQRGFPRPIGASCDSGAYELATCRGETSGARSIPGTAGADDLRGTSGGEQLLGFGGDDLILARGGPDLVCAGTGADRVQAAGGSDVVLGGPGADALNGWIGKDRLIGQQGRDLLKGGHAADTLLGGTGADRLVGGRGGDILRGSKGRDVVRGSEGADVLRGGPGKDTCIGGPGNDSATGCETVKGVP